MGKTKCLLVMGDQGEAARLSQALMRRAVAVIKAPDAIGAISVARSEHPDVIVVGSRLPGGSNFVVIERLRSLFQTAMTPIVALMEAGAEETGALLEAGADVVLRKPLIEDEAARTILRLVQENESPSEAPPEVIRDPGRLRALDDTGLIDTPRDEQLDRFTRLAARLLGVPTALISLVDERRQFFKSDVGLSGELAAARETPISQSYCQWTVATQQPLAIDDAREHPLVKNNPAIEEHQAISYCGVPLLTSEGYAIGTLCVVDSKPHNWTAQDVDALEDLGQILADYIRYETLARAAASSTHDAPGTAAPPRSVA
jgi:GAF domain-containing protein